MTTLLWVHLQSVSQSVEINSKHHRDENFEACCQWALLHVQIMTLPFTFTVQRFICNYRNYLFILILKVQVNGPVPKRGGEGANLSTRRTPPTTSPKIGIIY